MMAVKKRSVGSTVVPLGDDGRPIIPQPDRSGLSPDKVPPVPVPLTLPPVAPQLVVPPELSAEAHAAISHGGTTPGEMSVAEDATEQAPEDDVTKEVSTEEPAKPDIVQRIHDATDAVTSLLEGTPDEELAEWFQAVADGMDRLTNVVGVVAQQQQWTTNTIAQMQQEFGAVMGSGNPLKAIMNMMSGKKVPNNGG